MTSEIHLVYIIYNIIYSGFKIREKNAAINTFFVCICVYAFVLGTLRSTNWRQTVIFSLIIPKKTVCNTLCNLKKYPVGLQWLWCQVILTSKN